MAHKVSTTPRQGGFMAQCECGEITFGGLESRTAARLALRGHEEAPVPSANPVEGQSKAEATAENSTINHLVEETTMQDQNTPEVKAAEDAFAELKAASEEARAKTIALGVSFWREVTTNIDYGCGFAEAIGDVAQQYMTDAAGMPAETVPVTRSLVDDVISGHTRVEWNDGQPVVITSESPAKVKERAERKHARSEQVCELVGLKRPHWDTYDDDLEFDADGTATRFLRSPVVTIGGTVPPEGKDWSVSAEVYVEEFQTVDPAERSVDTAGPLVALNVVSRSCEPQFTPAQARELAQELHRAADILTGPPSRKEKGAAGSTQARIASFVQRGISNLPLNQNEYAVQIGYGQNELSDLLTGRVPMDMNDIERIAGIFSLDAFDLMALVSEETFNA